MSMSNIRVAVLGVALIVSGFLLAQLASSQEAAKPSLSRDGRYQLFANPARADVFLLDTQTGKTWSALEMRWAEGEPLVWVAIDRTDSRAQLLLWQEKQVKKPGR